MGMIKSIVNRCNHKQSAQLIIEATLWTTLQYNFTSGATIILKLSGSTCELFLCEHIQSSWMENRATNQDSVA